LVGESKEKDIKKLKERLSYWMGTYWVEFDNLYMKSELVHGWPHVKEEHDDISKIIKKEIDEYKVLKKSKKKVNEHVHELVLINIETPEKRKNPLKVGESPKLTLFPTNSNKATNKLVTP
jgi:hypothetical protein